MAQSSSEEEDYMSDAFLSKWYVEIIQSFNYVKSFGLWVRVKGVTLNIPPAASAVSTFVPMVI